MKPRRLAERFRIRAEGIAPRRLSDPGDQRGGCGVFRADLKKMAACRKGVHGAVRHPRADGRDPVVAGGKLRDAVFSRKPPGNGPSSALWIPAFAGMTKRTVRPSGPNLWQPPASSPGMIPWSGPETHNR